MDFYETVTLALLYSMILVGVWIMVSLTFYSNGNADIKWLKSGKVVAVMFGVYFITHQTFLIFVDFQAFF